jgi:hypothetical protein
MENFPFDTVALTSEAIDLYNDTYKVLRGRFAIELTGEINFQLEQFELFKNCFAVKKRGSYAIRHEDNNDCYIIFVEAHTKARDKTHIADHYQYQTWAIAYLKHDFGRVLIRRETLADKIIELVHPIELDFEEDKPFSDTFYVLVNDREKAAAAINRSFRNAVMDIREDDFIIEIEGHTMIIGSHHPIFPERAVYLAEFVSRVCSMC